MMDSAASQLSAAIFALMCSLTARNHHGPGLLGVFYHLSYARWGLEGKACWLVRPPFGALEEMCGRLLVHTRQFWFLCDQHTCLNNTRLSALSYPVLNEPE